MTICYLGEGAAVAAKQDILWVTAILRDEVAWEEVNLVAAAPASKCLDPQPVLDVGSR